MRNIVKELLNQIKEDKRKHRKHFAVMLVLSMLVVSGVLWQIKITGITMTGEALCGQQAHLHTEQCLGMQTVCGLEETEGHEHTDACKTSEKVAICQKEEHTHVEGTCYVQDVSECAKEEHQHTDACYEIRTGLTCGQEESEGHQHVAECKREAYVCGYEKEHEHTLLCYADDNADLETSADWEKTIQALNFKPAEDLAMVARSQIDYAESQRNYKVAEDGQTKQGYTRYGEWYGNPYGDWNAMFVSFCMHYAQHPAYETLKNSGVETMRLAAVDAGLYKTASEAVPYVGDLVYLDKDSNGKCDTVAIVSGREEGTMTLVEGDCGGVVAENRYSLDNGTVLGYALLTTQTTEETEKEPTKAPTKLAKTGTAAPLNTEGTGTDNGGAEEEEPLPAAEGNNITVTFVIADETYTQDPGNGETHLTVKLTEKNKPAGDGYVTDGGLGYAYWKSEGGYVHKVTGTGTVMTRTIPVGTTLADNGYGVPGLSITDISGSTLSFSSLLNWVTSDKMICNAKTVFTEDTTLYLSMYPKGQIYNLKWVCNCTGTDTFAGTHSVNSAMPSPGRSPGFALGESLASNLIFSAAEVNTHYTGSETCNVGSDHQKTFVGWYLKNETTGAETDLAAGVPFLAENVAPDAGYTVKVYARWEDAETPVTVTATFVNGEDRSTVTFNTGEALGDKLPTVTAPNGKIFKGWKIGDTEAYATAETVISEDTTYTAVFADMVTVTFVNGTETVATRNLAVNTAVGELPAVTVPDGKRFLGWVRMLEDGTLDTVYLKADDIITGNVTYAPVFVDLVTVTFMNGELQFGDTVSGVPVGAKLQDYLPANNPEDYTDDKGTDRVFLGWKIAGQDQLVDENTTVPAGLNENKLVLNAVFESRVTYLIRFHDIDPNGNEYVVEGVESIARMIPGEGSVMDWLGEITLDHDGALVKNCVWYYKDGDGTKHAYDLTAPVTSELHLYTYSYRLSLTIQETATQKLSLLNLFPVANAAEVQVDGNTLTLTLREGEKPSAQSLVVNDVDYSTYTWNFVDTSNNVLTGVTLGDILNSGVTQNLSATATEDESIIVDSGTSRVRFQVIVNNQLMDLGERDVTLYKLTGNTSYSISQETLLDAFGEFGFTVDEWISDGYSCPQKTDDSGYWANYPLRQANGVYYNPSVGVLTTSSQVLYLPGNDTVIAGKDWSEYADTHSFYTVTVTDPELLAYAAANEIPKVQYVFTGETATVTVPVKDGITWKYTGADAANVTVTTDTAAGTTTYTFAGVSSPIELTAAFDGYTTAQREVNFYVYVDNVLKKVTSGTYPAYAYDTKHYLSASLLEKVYGEYGFKEDMLNSATQRDFPHTGEKDTTIYSNAAPVQIVDGMWFSPILNIGTSGTTDVYYAPGYTAGGSANRDTALKNAYSFYTVTVTDPDNRVYGADETLPATQYVFPGTQPPAKNHVEVTVKTTSLANVTAQGAKYGWLSNGVELKNYRDNGDGTATYTVPTVERKPYVLTPEPNFVTVSVKDDNHLIYAMGKTPPSMQILKNGTAEITLKAKNGFSWLANGESLQDEVYNNDKTEVTYVLSGATEDVVLTPVQLLTSIQVTYNINLQGTPTSTPPNINGNSSFMETYSGGDYHVRRPKPERYTTASASAMHTVVFAGWKVDGHDAVLQAGSDLKQEELSQYGSEVTLKGVWTELDLTHTISFYINLELEVANFNNSTTINETENYTKALFGTQVEIDACPICDDGHKEFTGAGNDGKNPLGIVLQPDDRYQAAGTDKEIRMLGTPAGIRAEYMGKYRNFKLSAFPNDELMMRKIREIQAEYIQNFKNSTYKSVEEYRKAGNKIITRQIPGRPMEYIPYEELNDSDYTIRWYVFKYQNTDGWHIDGVLVRKQAQLTITKTFQGEAEAINAVKQGHSYTVESNGKVETRTQKPYYIEVLGVNEKNPKVGDDFNLQDRPTLYRLSLEDGVEDDPYTDVIEQTYTSHDEETNTYTWVVSVAAGWETWVNERNYEYHQNYDELNRINTKAEYLAENFTVDRYNQSRTAYAENAAQIAVNSNPMDTNAPTNGTVSFYNIYLPSSAVTISKVDQEGKPIPNVAFQLKVPNGTDMKTVDIWQKDGIYYTTQINQEEAADGKVSEGKITVNENGYAIVKGLQDTYPDYQFELVETDDLEGYTTITGPIKFHFGTIQEEDDEGNVQPWDGIILDTKPTVTNCYSQNQPIEVTTDGKTIYVPNVSVPTTVYAEKIWSGVIAEDQKRVTLQLLRNGAVYSGKVVTLDGTADNIEYEPWKVKWENLPAYVEGERAAYTLLETVIGESQWSQDFDDGYDGYVVEYDQPVYAPETGVPQSVTLKVTNKIPVEVMFHKVNHKNQYLPGAVFQLYTDEDCETTYGPPVTSTQYGEVSFGKVPTGVYYMKETTAPEEYQKPDTVYRIDVESDGFTITDTSKNTVITTDLRNTPITVDLNILKVDNNGQPLAGASFRLYKQIGENREEVVVSDNRTIHHVGTSGEEKGKVTIKDLDVGTYRLVEVKAPDGYYRMKEDITFQVQLGEITCTNNDNSSLWSFEKANNTITVTNVPGSELPHTGGIGTHYGTMAGLLMMASSLLYGFLLRRKRERGAV